MSSTVSSPATLLALGTMLALTLCGCAEDGPKLGAVSGKVTLDGEPVPSAYVVFQPIDPPGTYGSAYTDKDGTYVLRFSRTRDGAMIGRHEVSITTSPDDDSEPEPKSGKRSAASKGQRTRLKGTFEREVKKGSNVHDFDLAEQVRSASR
ncbi:carboxypeptidase-like regulatory domain-containing protein [Planctomicrobium sp. SH661]|uniref:carboxypeptidase-like regulatory domain-containing protein n=1 Tax=Planctomicrobium sp. SH661 TaxID=3448124 RepID=UPI003F5B261F